jgi:hypothetical protein
MSKKRSAEPFRASTPVNEEGWGGEVIQDRLPSGAKLKMTEDSDCILQHLGVKDIQDKVDGAAGPVLYLVMHDGRKVVSMPMSYAMTEVKEWHTGEWYYFHCQAEVETNPDFNPMKDFVIRRLGKTGGDVACPTRIHPDGRIRLIQSEIAEANYTRLNYPLRKA